MTRQPRKMRVVGASNRVERERIYDYWYSPPLYMDEGTALVVWDGCSFVKHGYEDHEFISVYPAISREMKLMMLEGAFGDEAREARIEDDRWWCAKDSFTSGYFWKRGEDHLGRKWKYLRPEAELPAGMTRWEIRHSLLDSKDVNEVWPVRLTSEEAVFKFWQNRMRFKRNMPRRTERLIRAIKIEVVPIAGHALEDGCGGA